MSSDSEDEVHDWSLINSKVLKRGEKDHAPDGTIDQNASLQLSRESMYEALSQSASSSLKNIVECDWFPQKGVAQIRKLKGNFFNTMGYSERGTLYIRPEELIYLVQRGSVVCYHNNKKLALEGVMALALPSVGTDNLLVYSHLKRLGYTVQRGSNYPKQQEKPSLLSLISNNWRKLSLFSDSIKLSTDSLMWLVFNRYITKMTKRSFYPNYASIYSDLVAVKEENLLYTPRGADEPCPFSFYLWKPSTKFRKSQPPEPDFRVVVASAQKPIPKVETLDDIFTSIEPHESTKNSVVTRIRQGYRTYTYAIVDNGIVAYINAAQTKFEPIHNEPAR